MEVEKIIEPSEGKLKEIILKNTGRRTGRWFTYMGYTTTFVYSKYNGNFIVRGYTEDVKDYLKENYTHYFYNMCILDKGSVRFNSWNFWKDNCNILRYGSGKKEYGKYRVYKRDDDEQLIEFTFKRMPQRWIKKFNNL